MISLKEWKQVIFDCKTLLLPKEDINDIKIGSLNNRVGLKPSNIQENNAVRLLAKVGFGGNIVLFICGILIVIGFDIIP